MKKFLLSALLVVGAMFAFAPSAKAEVVFVTDNFGFTHAVERDFVGNFIALNGFNPNITVVHDGFGRRVAFVNGFAVNERFNERFERRVVNNRFLFVPRRFR